MPENEIFRYDAWSREHALAERFCVEERESPAGGFFVWVGGAEPCDPENGPQAHFFGSFFEWVCGNVGFLGEKLMRQTLVELLEPSIVALGYELVELEFNAHHGGGTLRLYIDHPEGETEGHRVTVDDCEAVSRCVSELLDAADPIRSEYTLEVSSPGFDRLLTKPLHYVRVVGSRVHVESHLPRDGRRRWTGNLVATTEAGIRLMVDGNDVELGFNEIKTARLVPDFGT